MHQHGSALLDLRGKERQIILVGNPNVGKSVVFSCLTGKYVTVSNYPGTTVEVSHGLADFNRSCAVIDTPGVNSLIPRSEDERVTRDILLQEGEKVIIQVSDAKNLRRTLFLASQLAETGLPMVLDLNMADEAEEKGIEIDVQRLSQVLGIEVVETVAVDKKGIGQLKKSLKMAQKASFIISYDRYIEQGIAEIVTLLPLLPVSSRALAIMLLSGDESLRERISSQLDPSSILRVKQIRDEVQSHYSDPLGYVISKQRADAVEVILRQILSTKKSAGVSLADILGRWTMHPIAGIPFLLLVLYIIYKFVGEFGAGTSVDFLESVVFGQYINPWATEVISLIPLPLLQEFLVGRYGLLTMGLTYAIAIVLPIVSYFFIAFSVVEDTGYLPRLAIMVNRIFKAIGLNGKAVLPMVLGLGCDTMATMTTRILDSRKERVIATLLLALGVPCSAQLGVIMAMSASISARAFVIFGAVIVSQLLLVGFLASRLIPGESSDFIMEIPPFRMPKISNILVKTLYRVEWFLKEAVPLFLLGTAILFVTDKIGLLAFLERLARPVVGSFLNLPLQSTQAFILGFLRRDYGAAGLFKLQQEGLLDPTQALVSLVVITLFVPCIANFMVIIKERGLKTAIWMVSFIFPFAVLVGGVLNFVLRSLGVQL